MSASDSERGNQLFPYVGIISLFCRRVSWSNKMFCVSLKVSKMYFLVKKRITQKPLDILILAGRSTLAVPKEYLLCLIQLVNSSRV